MSDKAARKKAQTLRFGPVNPSFEKMEETTSASNTHQNTIGI
jgi:hypothetical protein